YVPKNASDITLVNPAQADTLEHIIRQEDCLQQQRGQLLARNSCRQPWISELDARFTKVVPTANGQSLTLSLDCFNLLNLLHSDWGLVRLTSSQGAGPAQSYLLQLVGYDTELGHGIYNVLRPFHEINQLRWRLRLSARYSF